MLSTKSVIGMVVLTVVLVGLSWYALRQAPSPTSTGPVEKITFGTVASSLFPALVWVAEQEGYFQHAGLDVDIRGLSSAHLALKTMLEEGTLDIVGVAQTPVVFHSFARSDYAIIATMADSDNNHKLLARKDRGIHTPADLKGKAIGVTKGTSGQFFLEMFLLTQGINPAEVETVDLAMGALTPAVVEGRVDAIATWEPYIFHAQRLLGAKAFLFDTHNTVRTKFYLVATRQFITQRPGALQKFLHAMRRAEVFIQEHNKVGDCLTPQLLELTVSALIPWDPCAAMSTSHTWAVAAQAARRDNALYGVRPAGPSKVDSLTKRSCQIICTSSPSTAYRVPSPRQSPWYHRGTNR